MPLRDHFRSPVNDRHDPNSMFACWPGMVVHQLFSLLPTGYRSAPRVGYSGGSADLFDPEIATVPSPTFTAESDVSEQPEFEVRIYDDCSPDPVAAIEFVAYGNKERPYNRDLFVARVASLMQKGVAVTVIDPVTVCPGNMYADLLSLLGRSDPAMGIEPPPLYAVTLRSRKAAREKAKPFLDAWHYPMTVGAPLPTLPIWLSPEVQVLLPLEPSYEETCRLLRIA